MPPTSPDPTIAFTVAIIAALALVIAGIINALIARAATVVSARQAAYKLNIEHCDLLIVRISTMG